ncbi:uncharacterized protein LOC142544876 [Primulina tabacum]|uniref:uncharacterized protein LOC142544876 n=1 Tax=Primulina tabacum TaxID=48773 RepID=UPI003F59460A
MTSLNHQYDLDLLLSLQDRVLETPPASPSSYSAGYSSENEIPKQMGKVDMSVFRDSVQDCIDYDPISVKKSIKMKQTVRSKDTGVEKFSGLRIRDQVVSPLELSNRLSDIRFVRLPAIKNLLGGDTLSGCWATVGILTEMGLPRISSIGKKFAIWKMGGLDENVISLFLFGDAYEKNCNEKVGTVFALFNCNVRKEKSGSGFSLSIFSAKHILKLGASADIGFCKGNGYDGKECTAVVNVRQGKYCRYHKQNASKKYVNTRTELKGGNLKTAFRDRLQSEGIYVVNPKSDRPTFTKSAQPVKLLSVEGLRKALSNADKVTTKVYSQGIRFLNHVAGKKGPTETVNVHLSKSREELRFRPDEEPRSKKMKMEKRQETELVGTKMIELDFASSDED